MASEGYVWGYRRSGVGELPKTHPHMIAWAEKETYERNQDRFQAAIILHKWANEGIQSEADVERLIHQMWGAWMYIRGNPNKQDSHLAPYGDAHHPDKKARPDHKHQATVLYPYLQMIPKYEKKGQWD